MSPSWTSPPTVPVTATVPPASAALRMLSELMASRARLGVRRRGVQPDQERRGGRHVPGSIAEPGRIALTSVSPQIAPGDREIYAAGIAVDKRDRMCHGMRQRRTGKQKLDGITDRDRCIERDVDRQVSDIGDVVGRRQARIGRSRQVRRSARWGRRISRHGNGAAGDREFIAGIRRGQIDDAKRIVGSVVDRDEHARCDQARRRQRRRP